MPHEHPHRRPDAADLAMCEALREWANGACEDEGEDPLDAYRRSCAECGARPSAERAPPRCETCRALEQSVHAVRAHESRGETSDVRVEILAALRRSGVLQDRLPRDAPLDEARRWKERFCRRLNAALDPSRPFDAAESVDAWAIRLRREHIAAPGRRGAAARRLYNLLTHATPARQRLRVDDAARRRRRR